MTNGTGADVPRPTGGDPSRLKPDRKWRRAMGVGLLCVALMAWVLLAAPGTLGEEAEFDPAVFHTIWGVPAWVFWGVAIPWLVANSLTLILVEREPSSPPR